MNNPLRIGRSVLRRTGAAMAAFRRVAVGSDYARQSYSQYGEDMLLRAVFARCPPTYAGFYVDVGAHHPMRYSNTRFFYEIGWAGICIDPLPEAAALFARWRPRDLFLQAGVAEEEGEMTYFMFDEAAMNTLSERIAGHNAGRVKATRKIQVLPLRRILDAHVPAGRVIDFLSVDVEGLDLQVVHSNDWSRHRPRIVVVEEMSMRALSGVAGTEISLFMHQQDYLAVARTPGALLFVDRRSPAYDGGLFLNFAGQRPPLVAASGARG